MVSRVSKPWTCHEIRKDHQKTGNRAISIECSVVRVPLAAGLTTWSGSVEDPALAGFESVPGSQNKQGPSSQEWAFSLGVMSFWVYILQSETTGRHYCGSTSDVERRLRQHNDSEYRLSKTTKRFEGPWALRWTHECETRSESMSLEKQIKKRGISRSLVDQQV